MKVYNNYKIIDNKLFLHGEGRSDNKSAVRKNQTTDRRANCLKIQNGYIENSGFPNFVEVV